MDTLKELYSQKGSAERYYTLTRGDVVQFLGKYLQESGKKLENVLEIGCSGGGTGALIKKEFNVPFYAGVELMTAAAEEAKTQIDWVHCDNIEDMIAEERLDELPDKKFDAILYLDVLEHLYNPWRVVEESSKLLAPGGILVGSIPNAGNLYVLWKLMRDQFEYDDEGLLDRTHIRFFTLHTIKNMLNKRFKLASLGVNTDTWSTMNWQQKFFFIPTLGLWKRLFIRQYLFVGEKKEG